MEVLVGLKATTIIFFRNCAMTLADITIGGQVHFFRKSSEAKLKTEIKTFHDHKVTTLKIDRRLI